MKNVLKPFAKSVLTPLGYNVWVNYKVLIVLLTSIASVSSHTKCVSLSNQKCISQPNLI